MTLRPNPPDADVVIVGAGPAGMMAAITIAEAGCSVIVIDMQSAPGGQIYRSIEANVPDEGSTAELLAALGPAYAAGLALVRRFRANTRIQYRSQTTVWEVRADGTVGWHSCGTGGYLRARHILLASGAMERPMPFPGWSLPGVMTAGAMQTLLKAGRLKPDGRVVLAGTGPLILLLADQLRRLGVKPVLIARTESIFDAIKALRHIRMRAVPQLVKGLSWLASIQFAGIRMITGISNLKAEGDDHIRRVSYSASCQMHTVECDLLVVHDGIVPAVDLTHGTGVVLEWDHEIASWKPRTSIDGQAFLVDADAGTAGSSQIYVTGDARQIGGADAAIAHGRLAASAVLMKLGKASPEMVDVARSDFETEFAARPFLNAAFPPGISADTLDDETMVCRCEELTAGYLRKAIRDGARDMDVLRGETRCGMGPCQGRSCMITVSRLIAENADKPMALPSPVFRARPPARPLSLGALATLTGLDPEAAKIMTLDDKPQNATGQVGCASEL